MIPVYEYEDTELPNPKLCIETVDFTVRYCYVGWKMMNLVICGQ